MQEIKMTVDQENQMDELFYAFQNIAEGKINEQLIEGRSASDIVRLLIGVAKTSYLQGSIEFSEVMNIVTSDHV